MKISNEVMEQVHSEPQTQIMFVGKSGTKYSSRWYFVTSIKSSVGDTIEYIDMVCQKDTLKVIEPLSEHKLNRHTPFERSTIYTGMFQTKKEVAWT